MTTTISTSAVAAVMGEARSSGLRINVPSNSLLQKSMFTPSMTPSSSPSSLDREMLLSLPSPPCPPSPPQEPQQPLDNVRCAASMAAVGALWDAADGLTMPAAAKMAPRKIKTPVYQAPPSPPPTAVTLPPPAAATVAKRELAAPSAATPTYSSRKPSAAGSSPKSMIQSAAGHWVGMLEQGVEKSRRGNNPAFVLAAVWHAISARCLLRPSASSQPMSGSAGNPELMRAMGAFNMVFSMLGMYACGQTKRAQHGSLAVLCMANVTQWVTLGSSISSASSASSPISSLMRLLTGGDALVAVVTLAYWLRRVLLLRQRRATKQQRILQQKERQL